MNTDPGSAPAAIGVPVRPARLRLMESARNLFYGVGIQAVGVDRIVAEAGVTKATFYSHFPGKDDLVRAYLDEVDRGDRAMVEAQVARHADDPLKAILAVFDAASQRAREPGYRGCPYINAAAEYPDTAHPVRALIAAHRGWLHNRFVDLLAAAGHAQPEHAARMLVLLWDGGGVGGYFEDPKAVQTALRRAAQALITAAESPPTNP